MWPGEPTPLLGRGWETCLPGAGDGGQFGVPSLSLCNQMQPRIVSLQRKLVPGDGFTEPRTGEGSQQGGRWEICISLCEILCHLILPKQSGNSQSGHQGASVQLGMEEISSFRVPLLFPLPLTCGTNGSWSRGM